MNKFNTWVTELGVAEATALINEQLVARRDKPTSRQVVEHWVKKKVPLERLECVMAASGLKAAQIRPDQKSLFKAIAA